MKQIIFILILVSIIFGQLINKPVSRIGIVDIILHNTQLQKYDQYNVLIPDSFKVIKSADFFVLPFDEDNTSKRPIEGNVIPYLTAEEIDFLTIMMDRIRALAETQLIP